MAGWGRLGLVLTLTLVAAPVAAQEASDVSGGGARQAASNASRYRSSSRGVRGQSYATSWYPYGSSSWSTVTYSAPLPTQAGWAAVQWSDPTRGQSPAATEASELRSSASDVSGLRGAASRPPPSPREEADAAEAQQDAAASRAEPPRARHWQSWQDWQKAGGGELLNGSSFSSLPRGHVSAEVDGLTYYYYGGEFFDLEENDGRASYVVVRPPVGAVVNSLPGGCGRMGVGDTFYHVCGSVWYLPWDNGTFVVVDGPIRP